MSVEHIVLLHGWGGDSRCWEPLQQQLSDLPQTIQCIDLPGFGGCVAEAWPQTEVLLQQLEARLPDNCLLLGWSLGGMLAVKLAARSHKVRQLVTIAANGSFIVRDDWPGMAAEVFENFCSAQQREPAKNWQRFCGLQARGDSDMRALLKTLKGWQPQEIPAGWNAALACLGALDNRQLLTELQRPALHIFGAQDALVPAVAAEKLRAAGVEVVLIENAGHCPQLSQPGKIAALVRQIVSPREETPLDKSAVARAFGRAATSYDAAAHLQRAVCRQLLAETENLSITPRRILDLGSGTGYGSELLRRRFPDAEIIALDIAPQMLQYARAERPLADGYIAADAEQLPLADACIDLVFSSFALQWCYRLPELFAEIRRVMAPGASALISTLGPDTLRELKHSWAEVDDRVHVNRFLPAETWIGAATESGLAGELRCEERVLHFDSVTGLMRELKSIGAQNVNRGAGRGMLGRTGLRRLAQAYDAYRVDAGLPASYEVIYLRLTRHAVSLEKVEVVNETARR
ncbi:malonyl-ACP O-methyltransferase BioC [uncultured Microbulbifer sp.]|uniref:malonyl-ACP O-methyltransferase BioC n=1 Tax=uncultured Microbulbifer sp. TaxID=348147 RepID=UPI0025CCF8EF|nr:malonyl-ACP O-methyltransferase BioC [uncultured Microbulbifer sp.]